MNLLVCFFHEGSQLMSLTHALLGELILLHPLLMELLTLKLQLLMFRHDLDLHLIIFDLKGLCRFG